MFFKRKKDKQKDQEEAVIQEELTPAEGEATPEGELPAAPAPAEAPEEKPAPEPKEEPISSAMEKAAEPATAEAPPEAEEPEVGEPEGEKEPEPEKPKKKTGFFARLRGKKEKDPAGEEAKEQPAEPAGPEIEKEPEPEPEEGQTEPEPAPPAEEPKAREEAKPTEETEPEEEAAPEPQEEKPAPPEKKKGFFGRRKGKKEEEGLAPEEPQAVVETPAEEEEPVAPPEPEKEPEEAEAPAEEEDQPDDEAESQEEPEEKKKGFFARLAAGLSKTRQKIGGSIDSLVGGRKIDDELLDELEEVLITADLGMPTTMKLMEGVRKKAARKELKDGEALKKALASHISEILTAVPQPAERFQEKPHVVMVVGVNGVGKTTSIGKLAHHFKKQGREVLLAAGDTFRAAASEQLTIWSQRVGCEIVGGQHGADPSSVAYDAIDAAAARDKDLVLIDTAGRIQTKKNLMDELKKIHRVVAKRLEGAPHEVLLVLDATTGQNAISQAKLFNETVPLTGLVLTKLDGSAKGGVVVAIASEMGLPILFVGLGEKIDDLKPFDPADFAKAIF